MKFSAATKLTKALILVSVVLCVGGLLFTGEYAPLRMVLTVAALLCLAAALIVTLTFCKCPYCGKRIFLGAATAIYCPKCRRNIETGKKASKKHIERSYKH